MMTQTPTVERSASGTLIRQSMPSKTTSQHQPNTPLPSMESLFALIKPVPISNQSLLAIETADLRSVPQHLRHVCNQVFYQAFFFLGMEPKITGEDVNDIHSQVADYISQLPSNIQPPKTNKACTNAVINQVLKSQHAQMPGRVGGLLGAKFPKDCNLTPYTLLRLNTGHFVHLTNSLDASAKSFIETRFQLNLDPFTKTTPNPTRDLRIVFGKGGQGKVRLGIMAPNNTQNTDIKPLAIKKIATKQHAHREIENALALQSTYLPEFLGFTEAKKDNIVEKYYLAYQLIDGGDGIKNAKRIARLSESTPNEHEQEVIQTAKEYAKAVLSIHKQGYSHSDVKLDNFLHSTSGDIFINDLGFAHSRLHAFAGGTQTYLPPETHSTIYDAQKHDSFSLGVCFLALIYGGPNKLDNELILTSSPQRFGRTQDFRLTNMSNNQYRRFDGVKNTKALKVNNFLDIVIQLLDVNPNQRLSVQKACDYFDQLDLANPLSSDDETASKADSMEALGARTSIPDHSEFAGMLQGIF